MKQECLNKISKYILTIYVIAFPVILGLAMFSEKFQVGFINAIPYITITVSVAGIFSITGLLIILIKGNKKR